MEINENNIQSQERNNKENKGTSVLPVIIMLIIVLIIGIGVGFLLSKNDNLFNKNEIQSDNQNDSKGQTMITTEENQNNAKKNIKIYNDKEYIYDNIEYSSTKVNKHVNRAEGEYLETVKESYDSSKELIIPYININSQDAEIVNEKMIQLYDKAYDQFKDEFSAANIKYATYYYKNIVSVVVEYEPFPISPMGAPANEIYMYTFDLETGSILSSSDICEKSKFEGNKEKIRAAINSISDSEDYDLEKGWEPVALDNYGNLIITLTYPAIDSKKMIILK